MNTTTASILDRLQQSGLLGAAEARRLRGLSTTTTPRAMADGLVQEGLLTGFQRDLLLEDEDHPLVVGEYVLLDRLGEGGMGVVYRARHRRLDRLVALKVLAPDLTGTPEAEERFHREVRAIARINHPNVVIAHDASEEGGVHYLVTELVEGLDLDALVREHGPMPIDRALDAIEQSAQALAAAHAAGIVHRDVKPSNLLRTKEGRIKLLDLGIARLRENDGEPASATLTRTNFMLGSLAYMAPEHAEDPRRADERSDVYSLGCTLFQLLTGRIPYEGTTPVQVLLAAREKPVPDLRLSLAAPAGTESWMGELQSFFGRLVAKIPDARMATMEEVASVAADLRRRMPPALATFHAPAPVRSPSAASSQPGSSAHRLPRWPSASRRNTGEGSPSKAGAPMGATATMRRPHALSDPGVTRTRTAGMMAPADLRGAMVPAASAPVARREAAPITSRTAPARSESSGLAWIVVIAVVLLGGGGLGAWAILRTSSSGVEPVTQAANEPAHPLKVEVSTTPAPVAPAVDEPIAASPRPRTAAAQDVLALAGRESQDGWRKSADGTWKTTSAGKATLVAFFTPAPAYLVTLDVTQEALVGVHEEAPLRIHLSTANGDIRIVELDRATATGTPMSRILTSSGTAPASGPATHSGALIEPGRSHLVEVEAHPSGTVVRVDGRAVMQQGQVGPGSEPPDMERAVPGQLGLVTNVPTSVKSFTMAPLMPPGGEQARRRGQGDEGSLSFMGGNDGGPPAGAMQPQGNGGGGQQMPQQSGGFVPPPPPPPPSGGGPPGGGPPGGGGRPGGPP
jgi:serine/threonine protein kinase